MTTNLELRVGDIVRLIRLSHGIPVTGKPLMVITDNYNGDTSRIRVKYLTENTSIDPDFGHRHINDGHGKVEQDSLFVEVSDCEKL